MNHISHQPVKVGEIANGLALTIPVYKVTPPQPVSKKVYIQANMHGAEVQGNAVIYQLLERLKTAQLNAEVVLVPYANPIGCNQKSGEFTLGRFDPITGTNWNRMYLDTSHISDDVTPYLELSDEAIKAAFRERLIAHLDDALAAPAHSMTTGKRIALNLQRLAFDADIVLDLHTGPISSKHLYCPEYAKDAARYFNIEHVLFIPNEFAGAMDEACFCPWWQLSEKLEAQGRSLPVMVDAFTVELGSQEHIDLAEADTDAKGILAYLQAKEALAGDDYPATKMTRYACELNDYQTIYAPLGGMVEYAIKPGQHFEKGDTLVNILRMERYLQEPPLNPVAAPFSGIAILHFASASVNQGTELYKCFTNAYTLTE